MNFTSSASLVRLLAALLLLADSGGVSKILCISPTGHEAVEDSMALCCLPGMGIPEGVFSPPIPCEGCTDYPVTPTVEITVAQPGASSSPMIADAAMPLWVEFHSDAPASIRNLLSVQGQVGFAGSPPLTCSLRC